MCGLCGALGGRRHWSDATGRPGFAANAGAGSRRDARLGRLMLLNPLLGFYGLALKDWGGSSFVLTGRGGNLAAVDGLPGLWSAVERSAGRSCDPLDPELLAYLEGEPGKDAPR